MYLISLVYTLKVLRKSPSFPKRLFFYCCIFFSAALLAEDNDFKKVSLDRSWLNLIHYKKNFFGGYTSEADALNFFFSKKGKTDPLEELMATFNAMKGPFSQNEEHPICKFPARALFLKEKLNLDLKSFPQDCPQYVSFLKKLNTETISVVFSSYFLDKPVSAFGHTFINFKKKNGTDLLNYASNYAANVTTQNPLLYGILGIMGGFKGEFTNIPSFYKIREYNDFESRDLWEYELNLTPKEKLMILSHLWEMRQTFFSYYYLTENCAYHILGLLNVGNPNWGFTEKIPSLVIPIDTIKLLLEEKDLVKNINFRPSKRRIFKELIKTLDKNEQQLIKEISEDKKINILDEKNYSSEKTAKILDAAIEYIDYHHAKEILLEDSEFSSFKRKLLMKRSKTLVKGKNYQIEIPQDERPDKGHPSRRMAISYSSNETLGLQYRFNFHDLMDPTDGHNPDATMEMGKITLNYLKNRSLFLKEANLANIISLFPVSDLDFKMSWQASFGGEGDFYKNKAIFFPSGKAGIGLSKKWNKLYLYTLFSSNVQIHSSFNDWMTRILFEGEAHLLYRLNTLASFDFSYLKTYFAFTNQLPLDTFSINSRWHVHKNIGLDFSHQWVNKSKNFIFNIYFYF